MSKVEWYIGMSLKDLERKAIEKAMEYFGGNKTKVAASLDVSLRTIDNKISLYRKQDEDKRKNS